MYFSYFIRAMWAQILFFTSRPFKWVLSHGEMDTADPKVFY